MGRSRCGLHGSLVRPGRDGHASGGEGAVAEGAVVAQEEADARASDLAKLGEEGLPLRLVQRRGIQDSQQIGVGLGRDHRLVALK